MEWFNRLRWMLPVALLSLACGDDEAGDEDGAATSDGMTATSTGAATGNVATGDATGTASGGGGGTSSGGVTADSTGGGSSDTGAPFPCVKLTCEATQICVHPCGGGAQPGCEPAGPDGTCPRGFELDLEGSCPNPCANGACCAPEPEDLTPYCVDEDELVCSDQSCDAPGCAAGELDGNDLICGCPP